MFHKNRFTVIGTALVVSALLLTGHMIHPEPSFGITTREEEALSREFMQMAEKQFEFIKDPGIVGYVEGIGRRLVNSLDAQPFTYHFYVIKKDDFNAFASPAGHIFIFSGLLKELDSEEELAGILGHEIGHSVCRHISQSIDRSKKSQFASLAGIAAGILLGIGGAGELSQAVLTGTISATQSMSLAYSREAEKQADQKAAEFLTKAGYNAAGFCDALEKIQAKDWFGSKIPAYLSTHPPAQDRVAWIHNWMESHHAAGPRKILPDNKMFQLVKTRVIGLYDDTDQAERRFENTLRREPGNYLAHYGYGLVLTRNGRRGRAVEHIRAALEGDALNPYLLTDLGKAYYHDGQYQNALQMLEGIDRSTSRDPETLFYLGSCRMKLDHLESALQTFEQLMSLKGDAPQPPPASENAHQKSKQKKETARDYDRPVQPPFYTEALFAVGEIYHKQGRQGESHYYLGRYYFDKKQMKTAIFHLQQAMDLIADPDRKKDIRNMLSTAELPSGNRQHLRER